MAKIWYVSFWIRADVSFKTELKFAIIPSFVYKAYNTIRKNINVWII